MSQDGMQRLYQIVRIAGLAVLISTVVSGVGCGFVNSQSASQSQGDPLHLGGSPGPQGALTPQQIQIRLGSEPSDRIVSLSLTLPTLGATNSGSAVINLLTPDPTPVPVTVEFTRSSTITEPISLANIYQDTYHSLVFPAMTGQVVFYGSTGQLVSQPLTVPTQTIAITPFALGTSPLVLSISLDLANTFPITDPTVSRRRSGTNQPDASGSFLTVGPLVVTTQTAAPTPAVAPAVGQPETGSVSFLVGNVTSVDTSAFTISIQPTSGDAVQVSYDNTGGTQFVNCAPSGLTGMMIETAAVTQSTGTVFASKVTLIDNITSSTELYGLLSGFAPEGIFYNLIVDGGVGVNETTSLIGSNVTLDWGGAGYSVNSTNMDLSGSSDLVFDEARVFPGQFVGVQGDSLVIPDPNSSTQAGAMQPGMFELNQQTILGTVSGYDIATGNFTLIVASNAPIRILNPGLISISVRQTAQTYLRKSPTFVTGDTVKVRGLLFADPNYSNIDYVPPTPNPVAFIMVAGRISK
jgi:hypothetical protein